MHYNRKKYIRPSKSRKGMQPPAFLPPESNAHVPTIGMRITAMKMVLREMTFEQRAAELNALSNTYAAHIQLNNEGEMKVYGKVVSWLQLIQTNEVLNRTTECPDIPGFNGGGQMDGMLENY